MFFLTYHFALQLYTILLTVNADGFGVWTSIYSGLNMYTEDRGLTMYTTYQYRLTVYNDFGHNNSEISSEVTTFGGIPTKAATVEAYSVNHTAIEVRWQNPSRFSLFCQSLCVGFM